MMKLKRILPALLFFLFICYIIILADVGAESFLFDFFRGVPLGDKLGHFMLYGFLSFLLNRALTYRYIEKYGLYWQLGSLTVFSFALLEEISQYYFPERTADMTDLLADAAGIVLFTLLSVKGMKSPKKY
ncbi:MAG: VanZ family protein [Deltaproteobacteria bacterium]|nr:VanZ family protein [Deltaproteobacteria bacterium]